MSVIDRGCLHALLLAAAVLPRSTSADIGPIVNPANGHSYYVTEGSMTWAEAEAWAVSKGGHLVAINDAAEDAWMQSHLPLPSGYYWLGGNDQEIEGTFTWVTGEPFSYQNFLIGEPDDDATIGGGGDFLALSAANWGWFDTNGNFVGFVTGAIAEVAGPTGIDSPSAADAGILARPSVTSDLTRLSFALPSAVSVRVRVYDVSGRLVRTLANGTLESGSHELTWDTRDERAQQVPSGVYFVYLQTDRTSSSRKIVVMR